MKKIIYIFLILVLIISCNKRNEKFDQNKWLHAEGVYNGDRISMVNDLINNRLTFGMEYDKITNLIGEPKWIDECNTNKVYELEEKYGVIDPNGYFYLELKFDENEKLTQWRIVETGYRE